MSSAGIPLNLHLSAIWSFATVGISIDTSDGDIELELVSKPFLADWGLVYMLWVYKLVIEEAYRLAFSSSRKVSSQCVRSAGPPRQLIDLAWFSAGQQRSAATGQKALALRCRQRSPPREDMLSRRGYLSKLARASCTHHLRRQRHSFLCTTFLRAASISDVDFCPVLYCSLRWTR